MQLLLPICRLLLVSPCPVFLRMPSTLMPLVCHVADQSIPSNSPSPAFAQVWCVTSVHMATPAPFVVEKTLRTFLSSSVQWPSIRRSKISGHLTDAEGKGRRSPISVAMPHPRVATFHSIGQSPLTLGYQLFTYHGHWSASFSPSSLLG